MIYKRFYIGIIIQVVLLSLTPILFLYVSAKEYMVVTTYSLIAVWISQIGYLLHYINKTNRDLARFFDAFQYQDSTLVFNEKKGDVAFRKLHQSFNQIINAFGKVRIEKEKDFVFFQNTVELVGIGLLAFDAQGKVKLCNQAFKDLFFIDDFKNIEELNCIDDAFPDFLKQTKSGKQKLRKYLIENRILKLAVKAVDFKLEDEQIKLVAFQDIKNAIDKGEMDAMHKLIRVFTHEIMNSVSPISLLSTSLIDMYEKNESQPNGEVLNEETLSNTLMGLKTIRKRSKGLIAFVDEYKNLTHLPKPHFELIRVRKLFDHIEMLFKEEFKKENIDFKLVQHQDDQELIVDETLITQVIINLIRNSIQAMENRGAKQIVLAVNDSNPVNVLTLTDNGPGIPDEIMEHIFTPFFTTKEKGSGIGLNLTRQIMRLHGGNVSVISEPDVKTEFSLQF
jgi:nitrogen fixation/metabolism regulation signal transduction histidine kinase